MSEFIYLYRTNPESRRAAMGTPEQAQKSMQAWLAWMRGLEAKGHIKDNGQPLDMTGKVVRGKQRQVTDGPFVEAKDLIAGFTIVLAKDIEEATALASGCPILDGEGSVEVRPIASMAP